MVRCLTVQAEARPLAPAAHARVGQPHLRDEVAAGELGQHPGVGAIGLAGQRGERASTLRVGEAHVPTGEFELVVDEPGAVHDLDHGEHLCTAQSLHKPSDPVDVGRDRARADDGSVGAQSLPVETLAAEIESGVDTHEASSGCDR